MTSDTLHPLLEQLTDRLAAKIAAQVAEMVAAHNDSDVLHVEDMAQLMHRPISSVQKMCKDGTIPARLLGGKYQMTRRAFLAHLDGAA